MQIPHLLVTRLLGEGDFKVNHNGVNFYPQSCITLSIFNLAKYDINHSGQLARVLEMRIGRLIFTDPDSPSSRMPWRRGITPSISLRHHPIYLRDEVAYFLNPLPCSFQRNNAVLYLKLVLKNTWGKPIDTAHHRLGQTLVMCDN